MTCILLTTGSRGWPGTGQLLPYPGGWWNCQLTLQRLEDFTNSVLSIVLSVTCYRERKKAHTDVLAQKVSLLEKSNRSLIQQLAAKSEEVTFLKSQLKGELTGDQQLGTLIQPLASCPYGANECTHIHSTQRQLRILSYGSSQNI